VSVCLSEASRNTPKCKMCVLSEPGHFLFHLPFKSCKLEGLVPTSACHVFLGVLNPMKTIVISCSSWLYIVAGLRSALLLSHACPCLRTCLRLLLSSNYNYCQLMLLYAYNIDPRMAYGYLMDTWIFCVYMDIWITHDVHIWTHPYNIHISTWYLSIYIYIYIRLYIPNIHVVSIYPHINIKISM